MSLAGTRIEKWDLQPGQWVAFGDDSTTISEELAGPFKVITRDDSPYDACHCSLMNVQGNLVTYAPSWQRLSAQRISEGSKETPRLPPTFHVTVLTEEKINEELKEKFAVLQAKASEHLKKLVNDKSGYTFYLRGYNPDNENEILSRDKIIKKYS